MNRRSLCARLAHSLPKLTLAWLGPACFALGTAPAAGQTVVFVEALFDGEIQGMSTIDGLDGARAVVVSPDGEHVYVAGSTDDAVAAFTRDSGTGALTWIEAEVDGSGGVDGLDGVEALAISHDGATLYAAGLLDNALAVFSRNGATGALSFVEVHTDGGLSGIHSVAVSPDDGNVYAVGRNADALVVYTRNTSTGSLGLLETLTDGTGGVDGLAGVTSVAVSPDGKHVYAAGQDEQEVALFTRSSVDGSLTFSGVVADGIGAGSDIDVDDKRVIRLDPSGSQLYVANHVEDPADVWIAVFSRNATTGALTAASSVSASAVDLCFFGIEGDSGIAFTPDGKAAYVNQPWSRSAATPGPVPSASPTACATTPSARAPAAPSTASGAPRTSPPARTAPTSTWRARTSKTRSPSSTSPARPTTPRPSPTRRSPAKHAPSRPAPGSPSAPTSTWTPAPS